jgi:DNA-binding transcriptional MerR regulator
VYDFFMAYALASSRSAIQIGEAAQQAKLSIDTIRFYERKALIPRASRTMGQFRLYTADDVVRLTFINQMQGLGFSLREIKQLLDLRDRGGHACRDVRDLLSSKLAEIRDRIRNLQNLERELVLDLQKCNRELKTKRGHGTQSCPILSDGNERTP